MIGTPSIFAAYGITSALYFVGFLIIYNNKWELPINEYNLYYAVHLIDYVRQIFMKGGKYERFD